MESSRGGPLTTFITTLPLIIVPAIAMLKPAGDGPGLVSSLLSASSEQSKSAESADTTGGDAPGFGDVEDEFDALFGDSSDSSSFKEVDADTGIPEFQEASGDSLIDNFATDFGTPVSSAAAPPTVSVNGQAAESSEQQLLSSLQKMGAKKTLWFSPGGQTFGFVAFFPDGPGMVSYRFEAIADSRMAAVEDVIRQVRSWKENSAR